MSTDKTTISSYSKHALERAQRIRDKKNLPHEYLEKPAMYGMLPNLIGKKVLCIGCGTGEECAYLQKQGAIVIGTDIAEGMIETAKSIYPQIEFFTMDMENLKFHDSEFDFIYSSLTFHYVQNWTKLLSECYRVLKHSGQLLFSTQHPVSYNARIDRDHEYNSYMLGYKKRTKDRSIEIFGDYYNNEKQDKIWPGEFKISYYNRPISKIVNDLISSGFKILKMEEPKPIESVKTINLGFYKTYNKIPLFIILLAEKP